MTELTSLLTDGAGVQPAETALSGADAEIWERSRGRSLTWPVTRLARWFFSLLLAAGLYFPSATAGDEWQRLTLVPLAAAIAFGTRALFELGAPTCGVVARLAAPIPPALAATCLMAGGSAIEGLAWSQRGGSLSFAATILTLAAAAALRAVEIREEFGLRRVYFVGAADSQGDLLRELARCHDRELVGFGLYDDDDDALSIAALDEELVATRATVVILDREAMLKRGVGDAAARLREAGVSIAEFATFYESEFKKVPLAELPFAGTIVDAELGCRRLLYRGLRRMFEASVAAMLMVGTLPLLLVAGIAIRLTSPGPALYRQRRVGRGGTPFTLLKLRTMTMTVSASSHPEVSWARSQPERVTWIGRQLRRFRVDELPQLWNVLRGELALIGPRPEQVPIVERLREELPPYDARHCIRPGITGWAQVNLGSPGSIEGTLAKLQCDLFYIKRRSLRLDALIVWLTFKTVLAGRGA